MTVKRASLKAIVLFVTTLCAYGCAYYGTPRPPLAERKLGAYGSEQIGMAALAADYRAVYTPISPAARLCAEAPQTSLDSPLQRWRAHCQDQLQERKCRPNCEPKWLYP